MQTFQFYDLISGASVATCDAETPEVAYAYRLRLQRQLGRPLGSLVPLTPEVDAAHVRLMVDRYRTQQECAQ